MRNLIVIRHSLPEIDPRVSSSEWHLSELGRRRANLLASLLADYELSAVVTSPEPKAAETAEIIADKVGLQTEYMDELQEDFRQSVPFIASQAELEEKIALFFDNPEQLVFGDETADEAHSRFAKALFKAIDRHLDGDLAVVTHGTVMTLFLSRAAGLNPYPFWKGLGTPSYAVVSLPSVNLQKVVTDIETEKDV